jgi:integrase
MEDEEGLDEAQALLDHSSAQTTKRYAHARLKKLKELALHRIDPFAAPTEGTDTKPSDAA